MASRIPAVTLGMASVLPRTRSTSRFVHLGTRVSMSRILRLSGAFRRDMADLERYEIMPP